MRAGITAHSWDVTFFLTLLPCVIHSQLCACPANQRWNSNDLHEPFIEALRAQEFYLCLPESSFSLSFLEKELKFLPPL